MSVAAIAWAFQQKLERPSLKLLLVAMADYAGDRGTVFPSVLTLSEKTSLDRKTVIECLQELRRLGLLWDTGKRMGTTGRVKVYRLALEQSQKRNDSENGIVPKTDGNSPKNGTLNNPESGTQNLKKEPSATNKRTLSPKERAGQAFDELIASEGAKRDARVQTALDAIGGWQRIRMRTSHDAHFIRRDFMEAYERSA